MRVLLDTHVVLWTLTEPSRLSPTAREILESRSNELIVSATSAWEIAVKHRGARLRGLDATVHSYESRLATLGASQLAITTAHALLAGRLDWEHRDPFDRMLAAQSMLENTPLITTDVAFASLPAVQTIW